jgi:hypothetical protein
MIQKILLATFAALICFQTQADTIAVYRYNVSAKITGGGAVVAKRYRGSMIIDDAGIINLISEPLRKRYTVEYPVLSYVLANAPNRTWENFQFDEGLFRSMDLSGADYTNALYAATWKTVPRSFKCSGTDRFVDVLNEYYFWEYRGVAVFDKLNSTGAVVFNLTAEQTLQRLINELVALGYSEETAKARPAK